MTTFSEPIPLGDIEGARAAVAVHALRTPLLRLAVDGACEIWLKLECLQPIGSFKIRGAANAMARRPLHELRAGVVTASAGNMAQGVAWCARAMGVPCRVIVPDHAPAAKTDAIERLGASIIRRPFAEWWNIIITHDTGGIEGAFIHPVADLDVIAGNGTIGIEVLEDLPDVDTLVVPYGGGGLSAGIASAAKALRPTVRVLAAEVETAAPFAASLAADRPAAVEYTASFVDGIGGRGVLEEMWPLTSTILDGSIVVSLRQIEDAIRLMAQRARVVAEGAGAASLAAALTGSAGNGTVVCIVSGGNIDAAKLAAILAERT